MTGKAKRRCNQRSSFKYVPLPRCSSHRIARYCCDYNAWDNIQEIGLGGLYVYGEPLPEVVIQIAHSYGINPHDLDWHVEAVHGWEPHDLGYDSHVRAAALCMIDSGYPTTMDKEQCREK